VGIELQSFGAREANNIKLSAMFRFTLCLLMLMLSAQRGTSADQNPTYLGIVEEHPSGRIILGLRVAFQKDSMGWKSLCPPSRDYKKKSECEVAARRLPKQWWLIGGRPTAFRIEQTDSSYYSDAALYPAVGVSLAGSRTLDFAGWEDEPVRPPLPALSRLPARNPGIAGTRNPLDLEAVIRRFRSDVGEFQTCSPSGEGTALRYTRRDLLIRKHDLLPNRFVSIQIDPELNTCDGPPDANWSTYWYRVNAKGEIKRVNFDLRHPCSEYSCTVRLINSLNADEDGKPEVLFWLSSYNEGGYALLPGNSDTPISFTWTYH
jgi:hypothetical protein